VVRSGDAVVDGRDPRQWNVSFVGLINRLTQEAGLPYYLAPGNHDVTAAETLGDLGRREGVENYLNAVAPLIPANGSQRRLDGYPTYAFGYGNTFVIAFDSNVADDNRQFNWVKTQLEGLDRRRYVHVVVLFHHPVISSGPHGGATVEPPTAAVRRRYLPLFRQHRVRLLLTGHEHLFEHWAEQLRDSTGSWQMHQVVSGGGGAPPYHFEGEPDQRLYLRNSKANGVTLTQLVRPGRRAEENPYHYCVIHVDGSRMWMEVIGIDTGDSWAPYAGNRVWLTDSLASR
jgi:3',5'-cyclic AMP phosphodiesterase CpdA